jgi:NAD(P)-dependent dehydrogenase (short-subunit alcohol dehydrogenase family)
MARSVIDRTCDVLVEADVRAGLAVADEEFGGVDGLFANGGTGGSGSMHEMALAAWESLLRVNLTGVFLAVWAQALGLSTPTPANATRAWPLKPYTFRACWSWPLGRLASFGGGA